MTVTRDCMSEGRAFMKLNACCDKSDESRRSYVVARKPFLTCKVPGDYMTYEAQRQIQNALRSVPWYMFLVPHL